MSRTRLLEVVSTVALILAILFLAGRWVYQIRLEYELSLAASEGDIVQVRSLLSRGANANSNRLGTALMGAAAEHHIEVVKLLLRAGAAVDLKQEHDGSTALMQAVVMARYRPRAARKTVRLLLESGADVNAQTNNGLSPLAWARKQDEVLRTKPEAIRQVVTHIAQPSASIMRPESHLTPAQYEAAIRARCDELLSKADS